MENILLLSSLIEKILIRLVDIKHLCIHASILMYYDYFDNDLLLEIKTKTFLLKGNKENKLTAQKKKNKESLTLNVLSKVLYLLQTSLWLKSYILLDFICPGLLAH